MFVIKRIDTFNTYLVPDTPHCGIGNGQNFGDGQTATFSYEAMVCISDNGLDANGFVVDNKEFKLFFDKQKYMSDSCEVMCHKAATHFFKLATRNDKAQIANILEISVKIWGLPNVAYAEYRWVNPNPAPMAVPGAIRASNQKRTMAALNR